MAATCAWRSAFTMTDDHHLALLAVHFHAPIQTGRRSLSFLPIGPGISVSLASHTTSSLAELNSRNIDCILHPITDEIQDRIMNFAKRKASTCCIYPSNDEIVGAIPAFVEHRIMSIDARHDHDTGPHPTDHSAVMFERGPGIRDPSDQTSLRPGAAAVTDAKLLHHPDYTCETLRI